MMERTPRPFVGPYTIEDHINNNPYGQGRYWIVDLTGRYVESWDGYGFAQQRLDAMNQDWQGRRLEVTQPQEQPEDSLEYLQDLFGHNQEILWERVQEASQASEAEVDYLAESRPVCACPFNVINQPDNPQPCHRNVSAQGSVCPACSSGNHRYHR